MSDMPVHKLVRLGTRALRAALRMQARRRVRRRGLTLTKLGTSYGGWVIVEGILTDRSACLCVGCGEDISFDVEIARRYGGRVALYDPTPRAVRHVQDVLASAGTGRRVPINSSPTQMYDIDRRTGECIQFYPRAISSINGVIRLYMPTRSDFVSCSMLPQGMSQEYIDVESVTIEQALQQSEISAERFDLMKLDIEGAEYDVISRLLEHCPLPKLICLELDGLSDRLEGLGHKWRTVAMLWALRRNYCLVAVDGLNVTLLRRDVS